MTALPPPMFDLDPTEYSEPKPKPRQKAAETLPPPMFETVQRERVYSTEFVPLSQRLCSDCRKPLRSLPTTMGCGGARPGHGSFDLCDLCAADDRTPDGLPRWGATRLSLEVGHLRRRVYAAGGGETEVAAELERTGLSVQLAAERAEHDRIRAARSAA